MTIKATDFAPESRELVQSVANDTEDRLLVFVRDELFGLLGLLDLPFDHLLDGEEDERLVLDQGLDKFQVLWGGLLVYDVLIHTRAFAEDFEELAGWEDGECFACF